ncbi:MAG: molybdopterin-binding protein [Spirochaetales bacterium]|nr:molybdopterin-binding protein [Spirochaetales bacterium]
MGTIKAICISEKRGVQKHQVPSAQLKKNWGIEGDAHAANWHRQISLLSFEKIEEFRVKGADINFGDFGENIVAEGFDFRNLPVGTLLRSGNILLEITQIGKDCHTHCAIYQTMGDCIMPREGVFAKVLEDGEMTVGDTLKIEERKKKRPYQAAVITLSDRCSREERTDTSGPAITQILKENKFEVVETILLPDDKEKLKTQLIRLSDQRQIDLIITTGGTGFSKRDTTPEASKEVAERDAPGIAEAIRAGSMKITPRAMLMRGVSVIRGNSLIINLPGSEKAAKESLDLIIDTLPHGINLLRGSITDCAPN